MLIKGTPAQVEFCHTLLQAKVTGDYSAVAAANAARYGSAPYGAPAYPGYPPYGQRPPVGYGQPPMQYGQQQYGQQYPAAAAQYGASTPAVPGAAQPYGASTPAVPGAQAPGAPTPAAASATAAAAQASQYGAAGQAAYGGATAGGYDYSQWSQQQQAYGGQAQQAQGYGAPAQQAYGGYGGYGHYGGYAQPQQQAYPGYGAPAAPGGAPGASKMSVPNDIVGRIIGKGGSSIKQIQEQSGAHVDIPADTGAPYREITITGDPTAIGICTQLIQQKMTANRA